MTFFRRSIAALGAAAVLAAAVPAASAPVVGRPAPPLVARALDGSSLDLAALRGRVVVVNLWATWCPPCREEMPALDAFYRQYAARGVTVIGLSADRPRDLSDVRRVMSAFSYPAALLANASVNGFGAPSGLPITIVVGPDGIVRTVVDGDSGLLTQTRLAALVDPLLPKPTTRP